MAAKLGRSKFSLIRIFPLISVLLVALFVMPKQVFALVPFSLNPDFSHIGWTFGAGSTGDNPNATYGGVTKPWTAHHTSSLHGGSDAYADDWFWGNGDSCGREVYAPFAGKVLFSGKGQNVGGGDSRYGYEVIIQADANNNYAWRGAHMKPGTTTAAAHVNAGDYIGQTSNTGTDDCHLHSVLYQRIYEQSTQGGTGISRLTQYGTTIDVINGPADKFAVKFLNDGNVNGGGGTDCNNIGGYNGVRLFDQDACNGSSQNFGSPTNGATTNLGPLGWNDRARSVYVGSGWSVKVFEHENGGGKSKCLDHNFWDLDADPYDGGGMIGSSISSVIIYQNTTCSGGTPPVEHSVQFYKDANYQGGSACIANNPSNYTLCEGWSDLISSVLLKPGWSVRVYENEFSGGSKCYSGSDSTFAGDFFDNGVEVNDRISSFTLYNQSNCPNPIPPAPALTSPGNGANINEGQSINLQWNGSGSEYYGEVWGGPAGTSTFGWQSGTSKDIGSQWPGYTYSWRVKARNSSGESGWSETRTFTVKKNPVPPAAPALTAPANGASFTDAQQINLQWSATGSEYYGEVWGGPGGTLTFGWQSGTSKNIGTQWPGHTYSWRVKAKNADGESGWSETRTFTVVNAPTVPAAPLLTAPINGASINEGTSITLEWAGSGTDFYGEVWGGPGGTLTFGWQTGKSKVIGAQWPGYTYSWRVKARNAVGESAWSATRTFTVVDTTNPPSTPLLTSPVNGATFPQHQMFSLQWTGNGTEYYGEITGATGTTTFGWLNSTSQDVILGNPGSYSWRVKARNSDGESGWSATRTLIITAVGDSVPPTGQMTAPPKDSTQYGPVIQLKANATDNSSGVKKVDFYAWSGDPWSNQEWIYLGTDTTAPYTYDWNVSALGAQTSAFVTIRATDNANNISDYMWDPHWTSFYINNVAPPSIPNLTSPANGTQFSTGQSVKLQWTGNGAEYYGEITGGPSIVSFGWQSATSKEFTNLTSGRTYTWKVKSRNAAGESSWSTPRTFYVGNCSTVGGDQSKFFTDQNCLGTAKPLNTGFANLTGYDNMAESVYLSTGKTIRVWSGLNRTGSSKCFTKSTTNFNVEKYDDGTPISVNGTSTVSSVEMSPNVGCPPPGCASVTLTGVRLYTGAGCGLSGVTYTAKGFNILSSTYNNKIYSIYVRPGWSLKIFANADKTGGKTCIENTVTDLTSLKYKDGTPVIVNGKSTISAVKIYPSTLCKKAMMEVD